LRIIKAVSKNIFPLPSTQILPHSPFSALQTRVIVVDFQSQAGESPSTGVGLSSVYAAFMAKVENSISIMEVQSRRTAGMTLDDFVKGKGYTLESTGNYPKATNPHTGETHEQATWEVFAPEGFNFSGAHSLLCFGAKDVRQRLSQEPLIPCEADCDCKEGL
jgi:hypothetical protein